MSNALLPKRSIAVLTSGGDSQGMNAALRAVVRTGLSRGVDVYAIHDGYRGMVAGGDAIRKMRWDSVGGILHQGGTIIGTARCDEFRTHEGRLKAAQNLVQHNIDSLVVIGGDGSLTGADLFRREWSGLLRELVDAGRISSEQAGAHPYLLLTGLVGSIDNDMFGTDMTIGADTALTRIVEAVDAITSTAASHQRAFVVEVMGRHCGYLALMGAIATGANWVLIPENPPEVDEWEAEMCRVMEAGRDSGRRHNLILVAEGATDRRGNPIKSEYVRQVLEERLGLDARVTILGHVQRGGAPTAFDRYHSTMLGAAAVDDLLAAAPETQPALIGLRQHDVVSSPLMENVARTHQVAELIAAQQYENAMEMRGGSFASSYHMCQALVSSRPRPPRSGQSHLNILLFHAGGLAPGMNTAVRAAVRLGLDQGQTMFAAHNGFQGLIDGDIQEMDWMSVHGWVRRGGAELGTSRKAPTKGDLQPIARQLENYRIDAVLMIGGWTGYMGIYDLSRWREVFPVFNIPMVCLPNSINNDLPGTELSIGSDTALNNIMVDVDKIKQSAVASSRVFVVEVMGRDCGYLALMSGLATGAERVYLPEEGITLADLQVDVNDLVRDFGKGKRLGLMIRNEHADRIYTTDFLCALFEKEGANLFDVRKAVLGHVQQGGNPSPFDRVQATRLVSASLQYLLSQKGKDPAACVAIGLRRGQPVFTDLDELPDLLEKNAQRPKEQWWLRLRPLARLMSLSDLPQPDQGG
jgi:6-phosphofructokinase 1